jgi:succinate dehydrogenase / fumarate reductase cytochrome b subunit
MNTLIVSKAPFRLSSVLVKVAMAISGLGMAVWLTLHMVGNSLWLGGPMLMNSYGHKLHESGVLWPVRLLLVLGFVVHIASAIVTAQRARRARTIGYQHPRPAKTIQAVAARSIQWTGVALFGFVLYHVLTVYDVAHPDFVPGDFHHNLTALLCRPAHALVLIGATALVALHLGHGLASACITLGGVQPGREAPVRRLFRAWSVLVTLGFALPIVWHWLGTLSAGCHV